MKLLWINPTGLLIISRIFLLFTSDWKIPIQKSVTEIIIWYFFSISEYYSLRSCIWFITLC